MAEDVDDLLNELIGQIKPQQTLAEVSSHTEEESPCSDLVYREVPAKHFSLLCQSCRNDMNPGEKHWHISKGDQVYWWCITCGWEKCNLQPPQE
jgi:hypothetical protein